MSPGLFDAARGWVEARLGADDGPGWLIERRRAAGERLLAEGFPDRRQEAWRLTPLDRLRRAELEAGLGAALEGAADLPEGVEVRALAGSPEAERWLGRVASSPGPFGDTNTSLFQAGLLVVVRKGVTLTTPLRLDLDTPSDGPLAIHPRVLVVAEEGSSVKLLERHSGRGSSLSNAVTEVVVGPGASVEHAQIRRPRVHGLHLGTLAVRVERDARYVSRVVALGGRLSRLDLSVDLVGRGASCLLEGLYVAAADEHIDHHTVIDHRVAHTTSVERYKGIAAGEAEVVFDGRVRIHQDAQRSSVSQENRNLLLSDRATVHTKPSLIIDADDVTAAHGATVGRLDEDALFYLRSRGVGQVEARALLVHAFVREILDSVEPVEQREELLGAVLARLG